jgi:hypothetical protein
MRWTCSVGTANSDPMLFHDPKAACEGLPVEKVEDGSKNAQNVRSALVRKPEDDQSWMVLRRIIANIGEIEVKSDDRAVLGPTHFAQTSVRVAAHLLVVDRERVMAPGPKSLGNVVMQVFIDLEPHHAAPGTKGMIRSRASSAA